jgi:N-succinyldiaminopimelate aminotransferase
VRSAKQFMSVAGGTPFQHAVAAALADAERHVAPLRRSLQAGRDRLCAGLDAAGFGVCVPQGGYFVNADLAPLGVADAAGWCRALPERAGVVAIPTSAFYGDRDAGRTLVRLAFCKRPEVIEEAVERLAAAAA